MKKDDVTKLIEETIKEVFDENPRLSENWTLPEHLKLAARLSCVVNLRILQKLGVVERFTD